MKFESDGQSTVDTIDQNFLLYTKCRLNIKKNNNNAIEKSNEVRSSKLDFF